MSRRLVVTAYLQKLQPPSPRVVLGPVHLATGKNAVELLKATDSTETIQHFSFLYSPFENCYYGSGDLPFIGSLYSFNTKYKLQATLSYTFFQFDFSTFVALKRHEKENVARCSDNLPLASSLCFAAGRKIITDRRNM